MRVCVCVCIYLVYLLVRSFFADKCNCICLARNFYSLLQMSTSEQAGSSKRKDKGTGRGVRSLFRNMSFDGFTGNTRPRTSPTSLPDSTPSFPSPPAQFPAQTRPRTSVPNLQEPATNFPSPSPQQPPANYSQPHYLYGGYGQDPGLGSTHEPCSQYPEPRPQAPPSYPQHNYYNFPQQTPFTTTPGHFTHPPPYYNHTPCNQPQSSGSHQASPPETDKRIFIEPVGKDA
jgi:hypothetical protein